MASISQIRRGIRDVIESKYDDLHIYLYVPEVFEAPAVIIRFDDKRSGEPKVFSRHHVTYYLCVDVIVERTEPDLDQDQLDRYIDIGSPDSISTLLYENDDLGLPSTTSWVQGFSDYGGEFVDAAVPHTGASIRLRVETNPTERG